MTKKTGKFLKIILTVLGVYILINLIVYTDVYLRARSSYLKGVQYLEWFEKPQLKKTFLDKWLEEQIRKISAGDGRQRRQKRLFLVSDNR